MGASTPIRGVFVSTSTVVSNVQNQLYGYHFSNTGAAGLVSFRDGVSGAATKLFDLPIPSSTGVASTLYFGNDYMRFTTGIFVSCDAGITGVVFVG